MTMVAWPGAKVATWKRKGQVQVRAMARALALSHSAGRDGLKLRSTTGQRWLLYIHEENEDGVPDAPLMNDLRE